MCELLGMSFNQPVTPNLSLRGFRHRGENNPHGWGIAYYPDESVQVIKEPIMTFESKLSEFIRNYNEIHSKIFIAHVRFASVSSHSHKNTHPFHRELNGKEYAFAHNGTLRNYNNLNTGRFKPIGGTDSENAFCYILNSIIHEEINEWTKEAFLWLHNKLKEVNKNGTFNCLMSDGEHLFCYHDMDGYNGLCFLRRKAPFGGIRLIDEDFEINLNEEKDSSQKGYIVATRPLTNENWENFKCGELIVLKRGELIFSSEERKDRVDVSQLDEKELFILKIIRKSPQRISLEAISNNTNDTGWSLEELKISVKLLIDKCYIKQDSRDGVNWDDINATFYTNPNKRKEIDGIIGEF